MGATQGIGLAKASAGSVINNLTKGGGIDNLKENAMGKSNNSVTDNFSKSSAAIKDALDQILPPKGKSGGKGIK